MILWTIGLYQRMKLYLRGELEIFRRILKNEKIKKEKEKDPLKNMLCVIR